VTADFKLLVDLRHEIIHPLPYIQSLSTRTVPPWLSELAGKNLFISTEGASDFHFSLKLGSYALAYWACETVYMTAKAVASALKQDILWGSSVATVESFGFYQQVTSPADLPAFDREEGLPLAMSR
jgi:hypothetical protein